jgi:hypothetical protein
LCFEPEPVTLDRLDVLRAPDQATSCPARASLKP